ncbi:MAG: polysaccharide deacetylase family protein [Bacillota bacterium]
MKYQYIIIITLILVITAALIFAMIYLNQEEEEKYIPDENDIEIEEEIEESEEENEEEENEEEEWQEPNEEEEIEEGDAEENEEEYDESEMEPEDPEAELDDLREIMDRQAVEYPNVFFTRGPETEKHIALTFDDGPDELNTPRILDILAEKDVRATFFLLGENVKVFPEIVQRIQKEGHQIGNHSWSHYNFREMDNEKVLNQEIYSTSEKIEEVTGVYPRLLRPPYGAINDEIIEILGEKNWIIASWSIDSYDWHISRDRPDEIVDRMQRLHHPGGIILMHNTIKDRVTVEALPTVIEVLRGKGYEFKTIEELLS